jgi:hypothetical protein
MVRTISALTGCGVALAGGVALGASVGWITSAVGGGFVGVGVVDAHAAQKSASRMSGARVRKLLLMMFLLDGMLRVADGR